MLNVEVLPNVAKTMLAETQPSMGYVLSVRRQISFPMATATRSDSICDCNTTLTSSEQVSTQILYSGQEQPVDSHNKPGRLFQSLPFCIIALLSQECCWQRKNFNSAKA